MKALLALALLLTAPLAAKADLFDDRARDAYRRQQESNERAQEQFRANRRTSLYVLANAFGAEHGGAGQFSENGDFFGNIKSLRWVTGDSHACEAYSLLSYFYCYDASGNYLRFWRAQYVSGDGAYEPYTPKARKAAGPARRSRRGR